MTDSGNAASSAAPVESYAAALAEFGEVIDFDISSLDRLGVPVTSCSLLAGQRFLAHGNGYGADADAARLSGYGELAEGVLSRAHLAHLRPRARTASYQDLRAFEGADRVIDPRRLCLSAGSSYHEDQRLTWLPVTRIRTGEEVWLPMEFVASEPDELGAGVPALITPITNGLGAGLDAERPLTHGLLELLQRHTNGLRFRALDARSPEIARAGLPASVARLVSEIERCGVELVLKHAGTELGVCSTYVMGIDPSPGSVVQVTACGEAAHPDGEVSLTKAVLEYANSRSRKAFMFGPEERARPLAPERYWAGLGERTGGDARALQAMQSWRSLGVSGLRELTAPVRHRTIGYDEVTTEAPDLPSSADLLRYLQAQLEAYDVLAATHTMGGVTVAKVVVPGLEVETLSYGRIGEVNARELLATDLDLVRIQDRPSASHHDRVQLTPEAEERLGGPVWYSYAAAAGVIGPLYPLYREPARHALSLED